ncbi:MAG: MBL fold metallo-hydrolase [Candidatus Eremiobacteraeota bacterium]|nr:MBL fold metallo-hydrolase [Candidatus Eremiobacteraeota bacterium]
MIIRIQLEDTSGDIIRKASNGRGISVAALSRATGIDATRLADFVADKAQPDEAEARAVATPLGLDPGKLADIALERWRPRELEQPPYIGHQLNARYTSNGYFMTLDAHKIAAFVDPGGNAENIISTVQRAQVQLQYILLTHKHHDHVDALGPVQKAFPDARPVIHDLDAPAVGNALQDPISIVDGETLPFGDGTISMLYTPGHTDGSACFLYKRSLFTGDTLFAGSAGKIFGERFGYDDLLHSIKSRILDQPDDIVVLPGHGPPSTVGEERAHNPFF